MKVINHKNKNIKDGCIIGGTVYLSLKEFYTITHYILNLYLNSQKNVDKDSIQTFLNIRKESEPLKIGRTFIFNKTTVKDIIETKYKNKYKNCNYLIIVV